ncbi:recombination regulator RecX [Liquorilactobacillus aquaticus DSM 21051]|uniref:Regulatory protein RecX n=1 Tax=Liquorilactobacillus aquaticus DSM 21051 TaxID=1423725 RepID=A0A0R2CT26_9LACO|nr:recombination regulator RecX [Liquorilactobacillus aquaticus]KRM94920.1 recombination regulator RecX [Liquorilactobacillus aquaticus DSM 21051]
MKITKIQLQKRKKRFNIYLNDKYSFSISEDVLVKYHLFKGQELKTEQIENLSNADEIAKAHSKALNYLSSQLRTEKEITDYLKKHLISPEKIPHVIEKLRYEKLVDDEKYAESYIRTMMKTSDKGFKVIRNNLRAKGVVEKDIEQAASEYNSSYMIAKGIALTEKYEKQYSRYPFNKKIQKIKQRFLSKGFSTDEIRAITQNSDFTKDEQIEKQILEKEAAKLWQKHHAIDKKQRYFKVKQALYRKGFSLDEIENILANF